ncbi:MAG: hypothetical protein V3S10_05165 [Dehalococcoidales bacterium]
MKRRLLLGAVALLVTATACSSGPTTGDRTSDAAHAFQLHSAQVIDSGAGGAALVLDYEVENLVGQVDSERSWPEQLVLASGDDQYRPTEIESLPGQLRETTLAAGESRRGHLVFAVPDEFGDFTLTVTLPVSGTEAVYDFRPVDRRIAANADRVLTRLEQISRTKRIPVIGGLLASLSSAPVRYLGMVLVPEDDIDGLLERIADLSEIEMTSVIEGYLESRGLGRLE